MGLMESTLGNIVYKLLMPKEVPDWFAGGKNLALPTAPSNSLRLLGAVTLEVADLKVAREFYGDALGAATVSTEDSGGGAVSELVITAGASRLRLKQVGEGAQAFPGHIYFWVRDISATLKRCQSLQDRLGLELVEEIHNVTAEDVVDALELRDPDGNCIVLNQAPRGFPDRLQAMLSSPPADPAPNVLALVDVVLAVPSGVAEGVARFFEHFLGAAITTKTGGWAVHFSPGRSLRQTLTFVDDAAVEGPQGRASVTVFVPDQERFKKVYEKCAEASLLSDEISLDEALDKKELRIPRCVDTTGKIALLDMDTLVRLPDHPDCDLKQLAVKK